MTLLLWTADIGKIFWRYIWTKSTNIDAVQVNVAQFDVTLVNAFRVYSNPVTDLLAISFRSW